MFVRIREVSTDVENGHLYMLVDFWPSQAEYDAEEPPAITNDFLMQLGRVLAEEGVQEVIRAIRQNLLGYWQRAQKHGWTGDHTGDASRPFYVEGKHFRQRNVAILRDLSDPHGLLATPQVAGLRNAAFEAVTP